MRLWGPTGAPVVPGAPVTPPTNTLAPVVSGTAIKGNTLSCTTGTWTAAVGFDYQWRRGSVDIVGANSNTYVLTTADVDALMSCRVTASNTGGSTSQLSNTVGPVSGVTDAVYVPGIYEPGVYV